MPSNRCPARWFHPVGKVYLPSVDAGPVELDALRRSWLKSQNPVKRLKDRLATSEEPEAEELREEAERELVEDQ